MISSLLDLNDDCLAVILTYLPTKDHWHFANVCPRFRNVMMINARTLYKRVELTGNSEELLLMQDNGDIPKSLYFKFDEDWVGDLTVLCKTLGCLINLENCTLNFTCPVSLPKILAIIEDLAKLPLLKDITMFQDTEVKDCLRMLGSFRLPAGPHEPEKVLKSLKRLNEAVIRHRCIHDELVRGLRESNSFTQKTN